MDSSNPTDYCGTTYPPVRFRWNFSDPDGDSQEYYRLEVYEGFVLIERSCDAGLSDPDARCSGTSESYVSSNLDFNTTYSWQLKVWDPEDSESDWIYPPSPPSFPTSAPGDSFSTPVHPYPDPDFLWSPLNPEMGITVQFTDETICYDAGQQEIDCSESICVFSWTIGNASYTGGTSSSSKNPQVEFSAPGNARINITDADGQGPCPSITKAVGVILPLPEWTEIMPFE